MKVPSARVRRRAMWHLQELMQTHLVSALLFPELIKETASAPLIARRLASMYSLAQQVMVHLTFRASAGKRDRLARRRADSISMAGFDYGYGLDDKGNLSQLATRINEVERGLQACDLRDVRMAILEGTLTRLLDYLVQHILTRNDDNSSSPINSLLAVHWAGSLDDDAVAVQFYDTENTLRLDPSGVFQASSTDTRQTLRLFLDRAAVCAGRPRLEIAEDAMTIAKAAQPGSAGAILVLAIQSIAGLDHPTVESDAGPAAFTTILSGAAGGVASAAVLTTTSGVPGVLVALACLPLVADVVAKLTLVIMQQRRPERLLFRLHHDHVSQAEDVALVYPILIHPGLDVATIRASIGRNIINSGLPSASVVVLTDFADSQSPGDTPNEIALLNAIIDAVQHTCGTLACSWLVLHRDRIYSTTQRAYIGAERKRGKLDLFNAIVADVRNEFSRICGNVELLKSLRYAIVLDEDSELTPGSGLELLAAAAHPLNRPDVRDGSVVGGYGIIAPATGTRPESVQHWRCAEAFSGSDRRNRFFDVVGERQYSGKGIYDIRVFHEVVAGKLPPERILSHDVVEGGYVRTGHAAYALLLESLPANYLQLCEREHRWCRGDFQNLMSGLPFGSHVALPTSPGFRHVYYWSLAARRIAQIALPLFLFLALHLWQANDNGWVYGVLAVLCVFGVSTFFGARNLLAGGLTDVACFGWWLRSLVVSYGQDLVRVWLAGHQAVLVADALGQSTIRMVTGRKLLEWASASAVAAAGGSRRSARILRVSGVISCVAILSWITLHGRWDAALIPLAAWTLFPYFGPRAFRRSGAPK